MATLSKVALLERLRRKAARAGSQKALAGALGVTEAYLSEVLHGRREPGPTMLRALGLRRVVVYVTTRARR